ncbi:MAG: 4Fe-4S dicluster domain-containing protein [Nitriliruptorales bacterium]|nr:4Fe-4S dicluster domain-containing protein [Nitriliruptorales bacterium]
MSAGVFTVTSACVGCGACLATCPEAALRVVPPAGPADPVGSPRPPLVVLGARCTGCAECAEVCPVEACVPLGGWR